MSSGNYPSRNYPGAVQISGNYGFAGMPFQDKTNNALVVLQKQKAEQMWGPLNGYGPDLNELGAKNYRPQDILSMYNGREVVSAANGLIAFLHNVQDFLIKLVSPLVFTDEIFFRTVSKEINQVFFQQVAEGGPFSTITSKSKTYTDAVVQKKLGVTGSWGVFTDKVFGEEEWNFYMEGLSKCLYITIIADILYSLMNIGWTNIISETFGSYIIDHAKVLALAGDSYGCLALSAMKFWKEIQHIRENHITDGIDTVIVPENVLNLLRDLGATPGPRNVPELVPYFDEESKTFKMATTEGPQSTWSVGSIDFFESPGIIVNSSNPHKVQPLLAKTVIGQFYPLHNPSIKVSDSVTPATTNSNMNNAYIYTQTYNSDDMAKMEYREALKNVPQFDTDGNLSSIHADYVSKLNSNLGPRTLPRKWELIRKLAKDNVDKSINSPLDEKYDNDHPILEAVQMKKTLKEQKGWRDMEGTVVYNPDAGNGDFGKYFQPRHLGDLNLGIVPNSYFGKWADAMDQDFIHKNNYSVHQILMETFDLLHNIDSAPYTDRYILGLIRANIRNAVKLQGDGTARITPVKPAEFDANGEMTNPGEYEDVEERVKIYGRDAFSHAIDWPTNTRGGMNLPRDDETGVPYSQAYPPGFATAGGLYTLVDYKNSPVTAGGSFRIAAEKASYLVPRLEMIIAHLKERAGDSTALDRDHTDSWHSKVLTLQAFLDHTGNFRAPIFMAVLRPIIPIKSVEQETGGVVIRKSLLLNGLYIKKNALVLQPDTKFKDMVDADIAEAVTDVYNYQNGVFSKFITKKAIFFLLSDSGLINKDKAQAIDNLDDDTRSKFLDIVIVLSGFAKPEFGAVENALTQVNKTRIISFNLLKDLPSLSKNIGILSKNDKKATDLFNQFKTTSDPLYNDINNNVFDLLKKVHGKVAEIDLNLKNGKPIEYAYGPNAVLTKEEYDDLEKTFTKENRRQFEEELKKGEERKEVSEVAKKAKSNTYSDLIKGLGIETSDEDAGIVFDTTKDPETYLRTPLSASQNLIDYVKKGGNLLVPADPETGYLTMLKTEDLKKIYRHHAFTGVKSFIESSVHSTNISAYPGPHAVLSSRLRHVTSMNMRNGINNNYDDDDYDNNMEITEKRNSNKSTKSKKNVRFNSFEGEGEEGGGVFHDFFSMSSSSSSGKKKSTATRKTQLGDPYDERRYGSSGDGDRYPSEFDGRRRFTLKTSADDPNEQYLEAESLVTEQFPGPWKSRFNYARSQGTLGKAALCKILFFKPFTRQSLEEADLVGQRLFNIVLVRASIEEEMFSCIAMKRGIDTTFTVFSRSSVITYIDGKSGQITAAAQFSHGTVRRNPKGVSIIPYAIPSAFIGGMGIEYINDPEQFWGLTNDRMRPSILSLLLPVTENNYSCPLQLNNDPVYQAPDDHETANPLRKHSADSFLTYWLSKGEDTEGFDLNEVSTLLSKREDYYEYAPLCLVLGRGPVWYYNPNTQEYDACIEGTGARGEPRMNIPGAYYVWHGVRQYYPEKLLRKLL